MNMEEKKESKNILAKLEAILFIYGESLGIKKIAQLLDIENEEAKSLLRDYASELKKREGGLTLLVDHEKVQLVTSPEFGPIVEGFIKSELTETLTPAALETLSIVAYFGPINRAKLDYIRGVNSTFTLRNLSIRGLIDRMPDPGRTQSFLYAPSFDAWKHLGVTTKEELPEYNTFKSLLQNKESEEANFSFSQN